VVAACGLYWRTSFREDGFCRKTPTTLNQIKNKGKNSYNNTASALSIMKISLKQMFYVNLICWQNAKISDFKISVINSI
jgi:hypothetical protein